MIFGVGRSVWRSCEASYVLHFRGYSASGKWQGSSQPDKLMKPKTQQINDDQPLIFTQLGCKSMYTAVPTCPCMCLSHCVSAWRVGIVASWWRRQSKQQTKRSWPKWNSPSGVLVSGNGPPALKTTGPKLYFSYSALSTVYSFSLREARVSQHTARRPHTQAQEACVGRESMVFLGCVEDDSSGGCTSSLFDVLSCAEANEEEGSNVTLDRKRWVQQLEAEYSGGSGSGYHARQRAYSARGRAAEQVSRRCGCCAASGCELQRPCVELGPEVPGVGFSFWLGGTTPPPFACARKP